MSASPEEWNRGRFAAVATATIVLVATLAMASASPYATVVGDPRYVWLVAVVPAGLLVAAALHGDARRGLALAAVAAVWPAGEWAGWPGGPGWARALAAGLGAATPVAAAIAVVAIVGASSHRYVRRAVVVAGAGASVLGGTHALFLADPFGDPDCWRSCVANPVAVDLPASVADGVRAGIVAFGVTTVLAAGTLVLVALTAALRRGGRGAVQVLQVFGVSCLVAAATVTVASGSVDAARATSMLAGAGGVALAVAAVAVFVRRLRARAALAGLIDDLSDAPVDGALEASLARTLADPQLRVAYWSAEWATYLAADGSRADVQAQPGHVITPVQRGDEHVAVVVHRAGVDARDIEQAFRPAARLWLDNARLRAATRAELTDLRASEARLAARSAEERRRIERDLHDGAQQRVVGVALLLRMLRGRLGDSPDPVTAAHLDEAGELLDRLLGDLRRVAHGAPVATTGSQPKS
ncbi:MAG TPA: histidine kinase [Ilumatobacter sp.]|nr:histidine kinase [Ilumatobacter sp.]